MADEEKSGLSILAGAALALVMACPAGFVAGWLVKQKIANKANDWRLTPVVVAAVDVPAETTITFDMISQRSTPKRFTTASMVTPDNASYVVNMKVHAPLKAGEILLWPEFEDTRCIDAVDALAKARPASRDLAALAAKMRAPGSTAKAPSLPDDRLGE